MQVIARSSNHSQALAGVGRYWQGLVGIGRYEQARAAIGRYFQVLASTRRLAPSAGDPSASGGAGRERSAALRFVQEMREQEDRLEQEERHLAMALDARRPQRGAARRGGGRRLGARLRHADGEIVALLQLVHPRAPAALSARQPKLLHALVLCATVRPLVVVARSQRALLWGTPRIGSTSDTQRIDKHLSEHAITVGALRHVRVYFGRHTQVDRFLQRLCKSLCDIDFPGLDASKTSAQARTHQSPLSSTPSERCV